MISDCKSILSRAIHESIHRKSTLPQTLPIRGGNGRIGWPCSHARFSNVGMPPSFERSDRESRDGMVGRIGFSEVVSNWYGAE